MGWNITSTIEDRWNVRSTDKSLEKNFESEEAAILYLKEKYGENVEYVAQTDKAIRWPDD